MIEHVYGRAAKAAWLERAYIATPDREMYDAASRFGATAVMTSPDRARATDRVAEAARDLPGDVVVNIQGDEEGNRAFESLREHYQRTYFGKGGDDDASQCRSSKASPPNESVSRG